MGTSASARRTTSTPTHLWRNGEKEPLEGNQWFKAHEKIDAPLETAQEYADRWTGRVYAPDKMIEEAESFITAHANEPFFLFYPNDDTPRRDSGT